jgi:hypothetical protein
LTPSRKAGLFGYVGGLVVRPDPLLTARNEELAALALRYALPAISAREFALAGGLMGYGGDVPEAYRLAGVYAGRILRGERPACGLYGWLMCPVRRSPHS